jgi:hypothetical protein
VVDFRFEISRCSKGVPVVKKDFLGALGVSAVELGFAFSAKDERRTTNDE